MLADAVPGGIVPLCMMQVYVLQQTEEILQQQMPSGTSPTIRAAAAEHQVNEVTVFDDLWCALSCHVVLHCHIPTFLVNWVLIPGFLCRRGFSDHSVARVAVD